MSYLHGRLASSAPALLIAAGLAAFAAPAFAADTTTTIPAGASQTTAVTASPVAPDTYTLNILGTLSGANLFNVNPIIVQGTGSGPVIINNDGRMQGRLNFTGSSPITVHVNTGGDAVTGGWHTTGVTTFGSGDDLIDIGEDGVVAAQANATFAFGGGANDRLVNAGRLITNRSSALGLGATQGTLTITGLETFTNSGLILLGSKYDLAEHQGEDTDGLANDRLMALGVAYTGSGASRIGMDVSLAGVTQTSCTVQTAADCIDFTGGSTAGSTLLTIRDSSNNHDGGVLGVPIGLIFGSSAAGDFTLSPDSDGYVRTSLGAALQKQLVAYHLVYDDVADRHQLVGILADEAVQSATFAASVQETWRSTAGTWFTRQADLRATPGGLQTSGGLWARLGAGVGERDAVISYTQGGTTYGYDVGHKQKTAQLVFGADLLGAVSDDSAWMVGAMAGFVQTNVEYDATPTEVLDQGFTGGLYASYVTGPLFVDALVNVNLLKMTAEVPNMNLAPDVNLTQDIKSLGGQVEAGWRFDLGGGASIEPLAGLSYVTTRFDDIAIPGGGGSLDFDDKYTSFRAGGGARLGLDSQLLGMTAAYSLTGRYWTENEGENATAAVVVGGPALAPVTSTTPLMDDFGGGFSEVSASLNLYSEGGAVSGFVNLGGKFGDDYRSVDGSVGVRLRW